MTAPALYRHRRILLPVLLCFAILDAFATLAYILAGAYGFAMAYAALLACLILAFIAVKDYRP